jgi:hypothetical protein
MHTKLITAYQNILAYKFATYNPPVNIGELINKLISLIFIYEKKREQK